MKIVRSLPSISAATVIIASAALLSIGFQGPAVAQSNPTVANIVPESEAVTLNAKITSIDLGTRALTLVSESGRTVTVTAGPAVRMEMLKTGDKVNVKFYRSVGFVVNGPQGGNGTPVSDDQMTQIIAQPAQAPGGLAARLTKVSGTVVGIDMASHSIDIVNPSGGGVYTIDVTDPTRIAMLPSVKVGDTVTAVVSDALAVTVEPAPKSWF